MEIRFISFSGPKKVSAEINFGSGLNLIYGPSNTGKSSVLDALDFMLGRERKLKEIPQHEGYDQVFLGIKFSDDNEYTLIRNINGGDFECFKGLHRTRPHNQEPIILKPKKRTTKIQSVSDFILSKVGLENKKLKKNIENKTVNLTLRSLLPLSVITETSIQKEASPYISEQYTEKTEDKSRLKFILTGVDDSTLLPAELEKKRLSRTAKIDILQELILEQEDSIADSLSDDQTYEELFSQKGRIIETIQTERNRLDESEEQYNFLSLDRSLSRAQLEQQNERLGEVSEMITRFELLKGQYRSDILRLENISEAGTLITSLPSENCPLCGRVFIEENTHEECNDDLSEMILAAKSEKQKLEVLFDDLLEAMAQLESEAKEIKQLIPDISIKLSLANKKMSELTPEIMSNRSKYADLLSTKSYIEKSIDMISQLRVLQKKKEDLEENAVEKTTSKEAEIGLPTKALFNLSQCVKDLLQSWNFPSSENIYFDKDMGDFVIDGKHRVSNGKGHRALTHAAATLGLMKYAENYHLPHLGFVVIDSPLLAYEEPENEADDLTGTDVNIKFFESLSKWHSRQIIVFENRKSIPSNYSSGENITYFTKSSGGRYGFFPVTS